MADSQLDLKSFQNEKANSKENKFSTRYRGSKKKLIDWIWEQIKEFEFNTVLDAMGGTGSVAYKLKSKGKKVTYNDYLKFNFFTGLALIENNATKLTKEDVNFLFKKHNDVPYKTFIFDTFKDTYFTDEENLWIDIVVGNIKSMQDKYKQAIAYYCLFQSCIIKRPYNLFHRKNLYVRFNDVKRSFGNKVTWDKPFEEHFRKFANEINECVFSNNQKNQALNEEVFNLPEDFDLVYIDTPYIPKKGEIIDYRDAYHFLEGITNYDNWENLIDESRKHKPLKKEYCIWNDKKNIVNAFDKLIKKFRKSIIVISYRSEGIPSEEEFISILKKYKKNVKEVNAKNFKYALSKRDSKELLFVAF